MEAEPGPAFSRDLDPQNMLAYLQGLPRQVLAAWQSATEFEIPEDYAHAENVVVLGMGGSAIGGDLVSSLVASEATVPVIVRRDYDLPAFVNEKQLGQHRRDSEHV